SCFIYNITALPIILFSKKNNLKKPMQKCFTQNFNGKNTTFLYFSILYPMFCPAKVPPQSCIFATLKPFKTTKTPSEPSITIPCFAPATHQQLHQQT
ncbi:MAG: hypothetical protein II878_06185, partial [Bacteroidales bacterium]|nr:hypothetical protein [Bacteroidales bacterium]